MGVRERLNELDERAGLRPRPGAPPVVRPLSRGRVNLLRVIWGLCAVFLVVSIPVAVELGVWWFPICWSPLLGQVLLLNPEHRRQIFGGNQRP